MSDLLTTQKHSSDWLVIMQCCTCSVMFGVPQDFKKRRQEDKTDFWCPNGHKQAYGENEADRLRREVQRLQQQQAMHEDNARKLRAERDAADKARAESERKAARVAKRISRGVCPGCNRTFANVARHMTSKHFSCERAESAAIVRLQTGGKR